MIRSKSLVALGLLMLTLSSCGGSSSCGYGGTCASGGGGGGGGGGTTTYSMGNGSGASFQPGIIAVSNSSIPAGGTTSLTISIVDQTGTLYNAASSTITLTSTCLGEGLATITPTAPTASGANPGTLITTTGIADATYTAKGCSGADVITATATIGSKTLTASGTVTVAPAAVGSIQFISATPSTIGLKGTGLAETSTVVFKVVDSTGAARPGASVSFSLNSQVGGLTLNPGSATSAADGTVQTVVQSGTVHTAVRVTAAIASPALSTQSSVLTVTTGIPASAGFSIAVGPPSYGATQACPNVEAYSTDGVNVPVTVRLADRYNNPAPDGTAVAFTTNGGHIGGNCTTPTNPGDGTCTVTWTSANPRPQTSDDSPPLLAAGRATVLATVIGEESFTDVNGDGFWEPGEPFQNLGEPFRDDNENGTYDLGEYFLDFNHNVVRDGPSGNFVGITCTGPNATDTCSTSTLALGASHLIIMSTAGAVITLTGVGGGFTGSQSGLTITHSTGGSITYNVQDGNGNPMAAGTTVAVVADSTVGTVSNINGSYTVGCRTQVGGQSYTTSLAAAGAAGSGNVAIQVTSPGTKTLTTLIIPVTVN